MAFVWNAVKQRSEYFAKLPMPPTLPDTTAPPSPLNTFHPFPRLPVEIRLKIWQLSVTPRTVEVRLPGPLYINDDLVPIIILITEHEFISSTPALLQVSREAREEVIGLYCNIGSGFSSNDAYFHMKLDTMHIRQQKPDLSPEEVARCDPTLQFLYYKTQLLAVLDVLLYKDQIERVAISAGFDISDTVDLARFQLD
ncbi:uncharacterized protein BP5553_05548 [Venustampulla echinocandica]|uniref:2EXR domain-containing protein n=1 Tax=Venustampulla echinocandica TaxID=2656787 RepID=A0A370TRF3_9HELO|nr:uncharacterized protein BP5553_05548 [Venustampulla echinocandica]RDL38115.1 hypothetical protein BP5553_05548 [Venustampulla echinocandica]